MKIEVKYIPSEWYLNEDNEWACEHDDYWTEVGQEDYYDPSDYYGHGYREFTYVECKQCGLIGYPIQEEDEDGVSTYIEWSNDYA